MNDKATCHTCETELPLDKKHFYKYKGKFWVYRCIECCKVHNKEYYRAKNPLPDDKLKAKDFPLGKIPQRMVK